MNDELDELPRCHETREGRQCERAEWHTLLGLKHKWEHRSTDTTYNSTHVMLWR